MLVALAVVIRRVALFATFARRADHAAVPLPPSPRPGPRIPRRPPGDAVHGRAGEEWATLANLSTWTDAALCDAWRTSYVRLRRLQRAHQHSRVVDLARQRGHFLDELERRHPEGFGAWIASGARPSDEAGQHPDRGER